MHSYRTCFLSPKVFYISKWTNRDSLCVSRQSWSAGPLTHSSPLDWKSCFLGPSWSPTTVLCSPSCGSLYFAPKCQAGGTFSFILKSKHLESFIDSIWPIDSKERVLKGWANFKLLLHFKISLCLCTRFSWSARLLKKKKSRIQHNNMIPRHINWGRITGT